MFERISLKAASERSWDVILAGSSFASMFFLRGLPRGLSVLILEKGPLLTHAEQLAGARPREHVPQENRADRPKEWVIHTLFGGNSNCWWGQTPRLHPSDFRMRTLYGVGEDWPIDYEALEPFYLETERLMEIAGGGSEAILPRSAPFPYPPHPPSRSDRALQAARADWVPVPTARSNGGSRAPCCANGVCSRCPIDSKFTVLNGLEHFVRPEARLVLDAEVRAARLEGGRATGVLVRGPKGEDEGEVEIDGDLIGLGTNAIFNAAILLRSGVDSPVLGRHLHEQAPRSVHVDLPMRNFYGGSSITGHGYGLYDGPHRAERSGVLIENFNVPAELRPEKARWTERLTLKLIAEDLPSPENRVVLEADEPRIIWTGWSDYALKGLEASLDRLQEILPEPIEAERRFPIKASASHIQGTTRMGADPAASVVDADLRVHGTPNLLALGSGAFPTCSPANPTLTLSALSLRAARRLA